MAQLFIKEFLDQITPGLNDSNIINAAFLKADNIFKEEKENLLEEFNKHDVTTEIESGPGSQGSEFLPGISDGNLFSFIGFHAGSNPTEDVRNILTKDIFIKKEGTVNKQRRSISFLVNIPKVEQIYQSTPYPNTWNPGSWVKGIETYISGLGFYLFSRTKPLPGSRSGPAVQIKKQLRSAQFKRTKYVGDMLKRFRYNFRDQGRFT